jgi:hypothetical protein
MLIVPPLISVVMPAYNSERYLKEAIESILHQTFRDFEFIIIADCSTDGTDAILNGYRQKDGRIRIYHQEKKGLIYALNKGCSLAGGKYIARMDADDVSLPNRLERQVNYLEAHPEIGILGTGIQYLDEAGKLGESLQNPADPVTIGFYLYFANCIVHPSVMMRREIVSYLGGYRTDALHAEDYDLWARACNVTKIANLPEVLLQLRLWRGSVSQLNLSQQNQCVVEIRCSMMARLLGPDASTDAILTPINMSRSFPIGMIRQIGTSAGQMFKLYMAYRKANSLDMKDSLKIARTLAVFFKGALQDIISS